MSTTCCSYQYHTSHSQPKHNRSHSYTLQVGSFNFDNRKMVFDSYLLPVMPNNTKSILDYDVKITQLKPEATFFVPAETGQSRNYVCIPIANRLTG